MTTVTAAHGVDRPAATPLERDRVLSWMLLWAVGVATFSSAVDWATGTSTTNAAINVSTATLAALLAVRHHIAAARRGTAIATRTRLTLALSLAAVSVLETHFALLAYR